MARYFLELQYDGTAYSGWQIQPSDLTVQQKIEETLSTVCNEEIKVVGCGRTDAGVHASQYFLHFELTSQLPKNFIYRLNQLLSNDIAINRVIPVNENAHARFDATYRKYQYFIHFDKNPFLEKQSYFCPYQNLDLELLRKAAMFLLDIKDFKSFEKTNNDSKTSICEIYESKWIIDKNAGRMCYEIAANRFLRGMVRRVVGGLLMVAKGNIDFEAFQSATKNKELFNYNSSVPPQGLFLSEIRYPYIQ